MNLLAIILYITIVLYFLLLIAIAILQNLPNKKQKIFLKLLVDLSGYEYKEQILPKHLPNFQVFNIETRNVGLQHFKIQMTFPSSDFNHQYHYNQKGDVRKTEELIREVQMSIGEFIRKNPDLIQKKLPSDFVMHDVEKYSFDMFLPCESLPQNLNFGII